MKQVLEREAKLGVPEDFRLVDVLDRLPGRASLRAEPRTLETTYYDTEDLRLARSGLSVRFRQGDGTGWTVKLPEGAAGPALVRREVLFEGNADTVPAEVADLVLAHRREEPLQRVGHLRTIRHEVELIGPDGEVLGHVVDDHVVALEGDEVTREFREVEVELEPGTDAALLHSVLSVLAAQGAVPTDGASKISTALGSVASAAADVVVPALPRKPTAGEVVHRALAASVAQLLRHDPGVRIGDDPEDVHQARVATRRLRSDLRTFGPLLSRSAVKRLRVELGWLADALGALRDADVLADRLSAHARQLPDRDAGAVASLLRRLTAEQEEARAELLVVISSERYLHLLAALVDLAATPPVQAPAGRRATKVLPGLVAPTWRAMARAARGAGSDSPNEELHALRILAKRCRYASEAAAPVIGKKAKQLAAAAAGIQTVLGDHQDATVAEGWLRTQEAEGPEAIVAGELIAIQRREAEACRAQFPAAWKRARRLRPGRWL